MRETVTHIHHRHLETLSAQLALYHLVEAVVDSALYGVGRGAALLDGAGEIYYHLAAAIADEGAVVAAQFGAERDELLLV